ncbi:MAG: T9SS type A sorting domain-containing protein [Bacteroidota bacterium]
MQIIRPKVLWLVIIVSIGTLSVQAQGWEKVFGDEHGDGLYDVLNTPDGGFLSVGHQQISNNPLHADLYLIKTDAGGFEDWSQMVHDSLYSYYGKSISPTDDGGYVIGGNAIVEDITRGFIAKTDNLGNLEWLTMTDQDSVWGRKALELADGTFLLAGSTFSEGTNGPDYDFFQFRVSADGSTILQERQYGGNLFDDCRDMVETEEGDLILAGFTNSFGNGHYDGYLIMINIAGDVLWERTHGTADAELIFAIANTNDGNFVITGQSEKLTQFGEDVFLAKIDEFGNEDWWRTYSKIGIDLANDVKNVSIGGYVITGYTQASPTSERQAFLLKTYSNGDEHWKKHFGGNGHEGGLAVAEGSNWGYIMAGFSHSYGAGGADGYLVRTDNSGISNSCFVVGNVHSNDNEACVPELFGEYIQNLIIEVAGDVTYFGTTDADGNYSVPVKPGDYNVRLVNPSPLWGLCEDSVDVTLTGVFDTAIVNFDMHPDTSCTYMRVDLSTLTMRRCFQNIYNVNYCNLGTIEANPAEIEVTFDPYLKIDSTTLPWTSKVGNTYTFNVGYLDPFDCGSFNVFYTVDCDSTVLGQTHCSEATITPAEFCVNPDPQWDEASIELFATCAGDSIRFTIANLGVGDMDEPLGFIIIEDFIVGLQGDFELESGADTTIMVAANGSTFRLEADQSPGHPGNSKPCISVEGCGDVNFNTGFVIQYPLNDADPFVDTDCRENIGSYDPNDKQGFPVGFGDQHLIEENTDIEYLIRFQNTGTDTAFTVVIRDTLSRFLDPTKIEIGGASHSFRYELYGQGILKFIFDEIMLPDSNINEPASHGFVKFRISQQPDLPIGTLIENSVAIYFDFNEPIITNTTFHQIGEDFIDVDIIGNSSNIGSESLPWVHVYPNPFFEEATFELKNIQGNEFDFHLLDMNGKLISNSRFNGQKFQFKREQLPSGIYFFKIFNGDQSISYGKIVVR